MQRDDRERRDPEGAGERPSDTEQLVGDTPASERLTSAPRVQPPERESRDGDAPGATGARGAPSERDEEREAELGHS